MGIFRFSECESVRVYKCVLVCVWFCMCVYACMSVCVCL